MANNIYLRITSDKGAYFRGNCKESQHEDWIEVISWSTSFQQKESGSSQADKGKPVSSCSPLSFEKYYDKSSDEFIKACWTGMKLKECLFEVYRPIGDANQAKIAALGKWYLNIKLEESLCF